MVRNKQTQRISSKQKNKEKKAWYKDYADKLDTQFHETTIQGYGQVSEHRRMKVNYDLFNNILDTKDFEYVCTPFGAEVGELPAKMVNRDIVSGKIKAMLGMEMKRPFSWKVIATNPEATTRKEQEEFGRMKQFVVDEIMKPIRTKIEQEFQQQQNPEKPLSEEEKQKIQQQIEEQTKAQTPAEVKKYMLREHQDPAEVLSHQLLEYLIQKCDLKRKFNKTFKHALLSAKGIMYVGILNGEPEVWNVNSMRFQCDKSPDTDFVEDGEWATCEYKMVPSEIIKYFGDELSQSEIDKIYASWKGANADSQDFFAIDDVLNDYEDNSSIRVLHCVWKSLRKIGFLSYEDEMGESQMMMVDENYQVDTDQGDIQVEWEWIPETYETWKIKAIDPIYVNMRPIPGQFKDLDNLYHCKLPYYGAVYDNMNSEETSLMDRLKSYQYYYNIVMYRLELLLASDKGKKVLMNINTIPDSSGIDIKKWQYFMESTPYMWFDPNEEGSNATDANNVAKVVDLSLVSDIQKYMQVADYLRQQCGVSVGITDQVEGQIGPNDAVSNTRQSLAQSSHILELYFDMHSNVKRNVLQALIETAKVAYTQSTPDKLNYVMDDMSQKIINMDVGLLDNSTLGLFVANSAKAEETKEMIRQLTHAALQNQKVELSDVISVLRQEGIVEAEETLKAAEETRKEFEAQQQQQAQQAAAEEAEKAREREREVFEENKELIVLKEKERRETEIVKNSLLAASFNPDLDKDRDGVNDFVEIARNGVNADIRAKELALERDKFNQQKMNENQKIELEKQKIKQENKAKKK